LTFAYAEAFQAEADAMIAQACTDAEFAEIVARLWPIEEKSERSKTIGANRSHALNRLWRRSPTNEAIRGTRWAAYQAITEYTDHFAPIGDKRNPDGARAERALTSASGALVKTRAFDLVRAA
jgi:hypothetical protein